MRPLAPLIAIGFLFGSACLSVGQSTDAVVISDAINEAGIRAQLGAQGYSQAYIDSYVAKMRKNAYNTGLTADDVAEQERDQKKLQNHLNALIAEQEKRQKAKEDDATRISALEALVKQQAEELKKAQEKIAALEAAQKKSGP